MREKSRAGCIWVIGYGNPHRRDDGIGPYVVNRLRNDLPKMGGVTFRTLHQLDPVLAEDLQTADLIFLVDATVEDLKEGLRWTKVLPGMEISSRGTHHLKPSTLLGLVQTFYHRSPPTWLVSVQGSDFGFGEGLSSGTKQKADRAGAEIARFVQRELH